VALGARGLLAGAIRGCACPKSQATANEPRRDWKRAFRREVTFVAVASGKCLATTASVSSGSRRCVFTPILLLRGGLGYVYAVAAFGAGFHLGPSGGYALVGMAAATAASTHAPMTAAVMVFTFRVTTRSRYRSCWRRRSHLTSRRPAQRLHLHGRAAPNAASLEVTLDGRRSE